MKYNKETGVLEWSAEHVELSSRVYSEVGQFYIGDLSYTVKEGELTCKQLAADVCAYCRQCTPDCKRIPDHLVNGYPLFVAYGKPNGMGQLHCIIPQRPVNNREVFACEFGYGLVTEVLSGPQFKKRRLQLYFLFSSFLDFLFSISLLLFFFFSYAIILENIINKHKTENAAKL